MKDYPENPLLILVRDTHWDLIPSEMRALIIQKWMYTNNILGTIMVIPDIKGVYYGRGVGYEICDVEVPNTIANISATDIRDKIRQNDDSWMLNVPSGTEDIVKEALYEFIENGIIDD